MQRHCHEIFDDKFQELLAAITATPAATDVDWSDARDFARLRQEYPDLAPETRRIGPSAIAQQAAPGVSIRDLRMDVREIAMRNAGELRLEAQRRLGGRYLDSNIYNFTFDQTGRVLSWFDPL